MTEIAIPQAETIALNALQVDGKNPNRMSKEQHERLATSIKKYGFIVPIITNKDLLIADGEVSYRKNKKRFLHNQQQPTVNSLAEEPALDIKASWACARKP